MSKLTNPTRGRGRGSTQSAGDAKDDHPDDGAVPDVVGLWRGNFGGGDLAAKSGLPVRGAAWCLTDPDVFAVGNDAMQVILGRCPGPGERAARVEHTFVDAAGGSINSVAFHATRPLLFVAADDWNVHVFDWQKRARVAVARAHCHSVMQAVPHRTLPIFASGCKAAGLVLWRIPSDRDAAEPFAPNDTDGDDDNSGWFSGCCVKGPAVGDDAASAEQLAVCDAHENGAFESVEFDTVSDYRLYTSCYNCTLWEFDKSFGRLWPLRVIHPGHRYKGFAVPLPVFAGASPLVLCGSDKDGIVLVAASDPPAVFQECGGFCASAAVVTPDASVAIVGHESGFVALRLPTPASVGFVPIETSSSPGSTPCDVV